MKVSAIATNCESMLEVQEARSRLVALAISQGILEEYVIGKDGSKELTWQFLDRVGPDDSVRS